MDASDLEDLTFRNYRGPEDHQSMADIFNRSREADGFEIPMTIEELDIEFEEADHFDPWEDVLIVEDGGVPVGWTQVWYGEDAKGVVQFGHSVTLLNEYRDEELMRELIRWNEERARVQAGEYPEKDKVFHIRANDEQEMWKELLLEEGYREYRYGFLMVRPDLEDIPELGLPDGVEIRETDHHDKVRRAWNESCLDLRDQVPMSEKDFEMYQDLGVFDPSLFSIAWCGDEVVGTCLGGIREEENEANDRKRGYTEFISVKKEWRGNGIAQAMMADTMKKLKERGMEEAALGVDAENPSGALGLYRKMGFEVRKKVLFLRKEIDV